MEDFKLGRAPAIQVENFKLRGSVSSLIFLYKENESDDTYKDLVQNEIIFIRKSREKIVSNVKLLYKQKGANDTTAGYEKSALDYQALQVLCDLFKEQKMSVDGKGSFKMEKQ